MGQDQQEFLGQREREFKQTTEKPRELKLIEEAQDQGILSPTVQLPLPEGVNKMTGLRGFFFGKGPSGLRIEGSWMGRNSVSLVPIGLQAFSETPQTVVNQGWSLLFVPLFRNTTAVIIPNFGNDPSIKGVNVALPLNEWPADKLTEVVDFVIDSRKKLINPLVHSKSIVHPYNPVTDIWQMYLKIRGGKLPTEVAQEIEQTASENQIKYSNQFQGI